ncbi:MAG TPA: cellulase family glycosylhydrolase [Allosphingosinicella sp.]
MVRKLFAGALLALALGGCATTGADAGDAGTMQVIGRHLYTAAGERVVLRGVNEMLSISKDPTGAWVMDEIAKTGANTVRIFTLPEYPASSLDAAMANAVANGLIPIPECHAATGKWERVQVCVDYWTRPEIVAVLKKHRRWALLNIANEAGAEVTREAFITGYRSAIAQIRAAGIDVPLMIDGSGWGQEYRMLLGSWAEVNAADPRKAVIVSAHSYWVGTEEERKAHYRYVIDTVTRENIPFVMGEGPTPSGYDCTASPFEWAMGELQRAEIGWLAWSWGLHPNGDCREANRYDMTEGGVFGRWKTDFGEKIALAHPASIRNTSRRPCSIPNAGANCVRPSAPPQSRAHMSASTRR